MTETAVLCEGWGMLSLRVCRVFFFPDEKEPENQGCGCGREQAPYVELRL
jgi:hypothetical protein